MYVGLSSSLWYIRRLLVYQLVLRYISVNRGTFIGLSISFKMYKR